MQRELGRRLDDAVGDGEEAAVGVLDDPESRGPEAGIDAEDPHGIRRASPGLREGGDLLFGDVEVGGHGLDVVVVLELLDEPEDLLGFLALDLDVILGQEPDLGRGDLDLGLLDGLEDGLVLLGRGRDLEEVEPSSLRSSAPAVRATSMRMSSDALAFSTSM